jgi:acyl carrier protein
MTKNEFLEELAIVLDEDQLDENRKMETIARFDSMGIMGCIAMIQKKLSLRINVDMLRSCKTIGDLIVLMGEKLS